MKGKVLSAGTEGTDEGGIRSNGQESPDAAPFQYGVKVRPGPSIWIGSPMETEKIAVYAPPGIPASMVAAYIQRCLASLSEAEAALDRLDHNSLRSYGHRLKGSGGAYGIPRLTEIGSVMEEAAKRNDTAELQSQLATLEIYLNRLQTVPD